MSLFDCDCVWALRWSRISSQLAGGRPWGGTWCACKCVLTLLGALCSDRAGEAAGDKRGAADKAAGRAAGRTATAAAEDARHASPTSQGGHSRCSPGRERVALSKFSFMSDCHVESHDVTRFSRFTRFPLPQVAVSDGRLHLVDAGPQSQCSQAVTRMTAGNEVAATPRRRPCCGTAAANMRRPGSRRRSRRGGRAPRTPGVDRAVRIDLPAASRSPRGIAVSQRCVCSLKP